MTDTTIEENTPPSVGQILKAARLKRGLTLEQISNSLFIPKRLLSHIEEDAEHLVCDVYTLGFVKLYAQHLGLNTQEITEAFKSQTAHHPSSSQLIFPALLPGQGMPNFRILALSLVVLLAIILGWTWMSDYTPPPFFHLETLLKKNEPVVKEKNESSISLPLQQTPFPEFSVNEETTPPEPISENPEASSNETTEPAEDLISNLITPPQKVTLEVTEKAWIEAKDREGNIILSRLFEPGESFEFKDSKNLTLTTGNLQGTRLSSGERIFPVSSQSGKIGRDIPLDPEKWME